MGDGAAGAGDAAGGFASSWLIRELMFFSFWITGTGWEITCPTALMRMESRSAVIGIPAAPE